MTTWVKCKGAAGSGAEIFINLDQVMSMTNYGSGTRLALGGTGDSNQTYVDVAETPSEILGARPAEEISQWAGRSENGCIGWREAASKTTVI